MLGLLPLSGFCNLPVVVLVKVVLMILIGVVVAGCGIGS